MNGIFIQPYKHAVKGLGVTVLCLKSKTQCSKFYLKIVVFSVQRGHYTGLISECFTKFSEKWIRQYTYVCM